MGSLSKSNVGGLRGIKGGRQSPAPEPAISPGAAATKPSEGIRLMLPEAIAERVKQAVLGHQLEWESRVPLALGKDVALVHLIIGPTGHVVLIYVEAIEEAARYPSYYLSSLCVRACRKSRSANCSRLPSVVLLVNDDDAIGRWTLESDACRGAGLISDFKADVVGDWDDNSVKEKVAEWTQQLRNDGSQPPRIAQIDNSARRLGSTVLRATTGPGQYFVFIASPGDTQDERKQIEDFFVDYNNQNLQRGVILQTLTWEKLLSSRVGDPQKTIFEDLLQPNVARLVLMICVLKHKLGGDANRESGTIQEFDWALDKRGSSLPTLEIKWFFSEEECLIGGRSSNQQRDEEKFRQYNEALVFRGKIIKSNQYGYVWYKHDFVQKLQHDLGLWLNNPKRPWNTTATEQTSSPEQTSIWETSGASGNTGKLG